MLEAGRRHLGQQLRKLDRRRRRRFEEGVVVRDLRHLPMHGVDDLAPAMPDIDVPQPGKPVEDAPPRRIPQINALRPLDDADALGMQRLHVGERMQVMRRVARLHRQQRCRDIARKGHGDHRRIAAHASLFPN